MFINYTSLIIPTRNRPNFINNLLKYFSEYSFNFFEIIVVDSSDKEIQNLVSDSCKEFSANYFHTWPSTSHQRNFGIDKRDINNKYVMFLDDDVSFLPNSISEMDKLIKKYENDDNVSAFGFNQIQIQKTHFFEILKKSKLSQSLSLYSSKPGIVMKSGWHTKILNIQKDCFADWIFTTACIYKNKSIRSFRFDETLGVYSYLEDLDFSLNLKSINKKIVISSEAKFTHPINIDRSSFDFGVVEVFNRYKIVKKHKLSVFYFIIASLIRFLISFLGIFKFNLKLFLRSFGNILGLIKCLKYK